MSRAGLAETMVERYLAACSDLDAEAFRTAYAVLGAQRNCKILGLFSRLANPGGQNPVSCAPGPGARPS